MPASSYRFPSFGSGGPTFGGGRGDPISVPVGSGGPDQAVSIANSVRRYRYPRPGQESRTRSRNFAPGRTAQQGAFSHGGGSGGTSRLIQGGANQQQAAPPAPGIQTDTSITPGTLFSPAQTGMLTSQMAGEAFAPNPEFLMKQFSRPGMSRDAGTLSSIAPQIAQGQTEAANIMAIRPLLDQLRNSEFLLSGQRAQGQEALGLANQGMSLFNAQANAQQQQMIPLLQMLLGGL